MGYYVCLDSKKLLLTFLKGKLLRRDRIRGDVVFSPGVNKALNILAFALEVTWASFLLRVIQSQEVMQKA